MVFPRAPDMARIDSVKRRMDRLDYRNLQKSQICKNAGQLFFSLESAVATAPGPLRPLLAIQPKTF